MKFSEAATMVAAATMEGFCVRNAFIPPLSSFILVVPIFFPFFSSRFRRKRRSYMLSQCDAQSDNVDSALPVFKVLSIVPFLSPAMCPPRRASSKSPTITRDFTEMENVRISDFHGFPLSHFLPLFDFLRGSRHSFLFRFFSSVCLRLNYSTAYSLFLSLFSTLFFTRYLFRKLIIFTRNLHSINTRKLYFSTYA